MNMKSILIAVVFCMLGIAGAFVYVTFSERDTAFETPDGQNPNFQANPQIDNNAPIGNQQMAAQMPQNPQMAQNPQAAQGFPQPQQDFQGAQNPQALQQGATPTAPATRRVVVNNVALTPETIAQLEATYRTPIADGNYWYDKMNGSWGVQGGPVSGYLQPNLPLGGQLSPNASGSNSTGVYINGRELHPTDIANLNALFAPYGSRTMPGRYWVDASGNFGVEGQQVALGNLMQMMQGLKKSGGGGGNSYYKTNGSDYTGFGSGGGFGYYGSKRTYGADKGSSSVYTNEDGSVDIYYEPKTD